MNFSIPSSTINLEMIPLHALTDMQHIILLARELLMINKCLKAPHWHTKDT